MLPVRLDPCRHQARNENVALAGIHIRVHDRAGVFRGNGGVSGRQPDSGAELRRRFNKWCGRELANPHRRRDCPRGDAVPGAAVVAHVVRHKGRLRGELWLRCAAQTQRIFGTQTHLSGRINTAHSLANVNVAEKGYFDGLFA
jgi:hypothetical protein